mgnify:CR=1 FL=1
MATGLWTDYAATSFAGGNGTSSSPYQISTPAQLAYFAKLIKNSNTTYRDSYFQLTADIDLSAHYWSPIGTSSAPFRRTFDGQYHKISNMTIDTSIYSSDVIGLFGYTATPSTTEIAEIKNFYLVSPHIIDNDATYASFVLANHTNRVSIHDIEIIDGHYSYASYSSTIESSSYFGCFLSKAISVSACYATVHDVNALSTYIRSNKQYTGGLIGYYEVGEGNNEIYNSNIVITDLVCPHGIYVGGAIGYLDHENYYNMYLQNISVQIQDGQVNSNTIIGGIIGYYCNNISKSYNYININNISSDILNMYPSPTKFKAFVGDWKTGITSANFKSTNKLSKLYYNTEVSKTGYNSGLFSDTENTTIVKSYKYSDTCNVYDTSTNTTVMNYYNVAHKIACRTFSVQVTKSGSVTYREIIYLNDIYKRAHTLEPIKFILMYDLGDFNPYDESTLNFPIFALVTGTTYTFPDADIYSYLNPTLERYDLENNNKWLSESQQTLNDASAIYHPGDTVDVSTDFVIWTGSVDKTKVISYKKDSSTVVDVTNVVYKNSSSTVRSMADYKYKKDSSTVV